jgi:hypothetical protein
MSITLDENFEGTGYENSWSEAVAGGNTVDEDAPTSDVSSPILWQDQCLKIDVVATASNAYAVTTDGGDNAKSYTSFETILTAESFADTNVGLIATARNTTSGKLPWRIYFRQDAVVGLRFLMNAKHDDTSNFFFSTAISLDTKYRIEVEWNSDDDTWEWKVNGVSQDNGTLTSTHETNIDQLLIGHSAAGSTANFTAYVDNVAIDTATWVGPIAEANITLPSVTIESFAGALADITLPSVSLSAQGHLAADIDIILPVLTVQGGSGATGSITLPILSISSTSLSHGTVDLSLSALSVTSTSLSHGITGLDLPILSINSLAKNHANTDITLPSVSLSAQGHLATDVSLALPVPTIESFTGALVDITLPIFTVVAGEREGVDVTLPLLILSARAYKGSAPECVVMNTKNFAISEYLNYGFNSMTRFNGVNLICDQNGIYEQDISDTDNAGIDDYKIKSHIKSGQIDVYSGTMQRLRNAWINYESDGDIRLTTQGDNINTRKYLINFDGKNGINERRIKFERGIRDRVFNFKTENINGSDMEIKSINITLEPLASGKG